MNPEATEAVRVAEESLKEEAPRHRYHRHNRNKYTPIPDEPFEPYQHGSSRQLRRQEERRIAKQDNAMERAARLQAEYNKRLMAKRAKQMKKPEETKND